MSGSIGSVAAPLRGLLNPLTGNLSGITGVLDPSGLITPLTALAAGTQVTGLLDPVTGLLLPALPGNLGVNGLLGPITGTVLGGGLIAPATNLLADPTSLIGTVTGLLQSLNNPTTGVFTVLNGLQLDAGNNTLTDPVTGLVRNLVTGQLLDGTSGLPVVGDLLPSGVNAGSLLPALSNLNVTAFGTSTVNQSGVFTATVGLGSTVIVERNAATPAGDPVTVVFDTAAIGVGSKVVVREAYLDVNGLASLSALGGYEIGNRGILELSDGLNVSLLSNIAFTGVGGRLVLGDGLSLGGGPGLSLLSGVSGFDRDDVITFQNVGAATSARYQDGAVQLLSGGNVVASVGVSSNAFGNGEALGFQSDGLGGISVGVGLGNGGGLPNDIFTVGTHTEYLIAATPQRSLYLQDEVGGRDGVSITADAKYVVFSDGIGRFDSNGTAQDAARLYRAALDRPAEAAGLEFYINILDSGQTDLVQVAQNFTQAPEFLAKYGQLSNAGFVNQIYQNVLDRSATAGEINFYVSQLDAGTTRGRVLLSFADSPEYIAKSLGFAGDLHYGQAYRLYEAALDRTPDTAGLGFYVNRLQQGATLQDIAANFTASPEFTARYGTLSNAQYVDLLYENVLGRDPGQGELDFYTTLLAQGSSREAVLIGFSESVENRINTADATHDSWVYLGNA